MTFENRRPFAGPVDGAQASSRNDRKVEGWILKALEGLRYGSVEIIVHDAEVIQIERKEKLRFDGRN